jgi:hypothetical protein
MGSEMKRTRKKKVSTKEHTFSIRMPEKIRYALDLLARRHHTQVSAIVMKSILKEFEVENFTTLAPGEHLSLMDKLWASSEPVRVVNLAAHAPELLTDEERDVVNVILRSSALWTRDGKLPDNCDPELWISLRGGVVDMDAVGRFWDYIVQTARKEIPEPDFVAMEKDFWAGAPRGDFAVVDDFEDLSRAD